MTLNNFCDNEFFTDTKDTEHLVLKNFSMTAVSGSTTVLDIQVGGNVVEVDSWSASGDYLGSNATYNLVMKENISGLEIKMENLVEDFSYDSFDVNMEVNGRIYHSDFGYYDVKTLQTLVITGMNDMPTQGVIEFKGANTLTMTFSGDPASPVITIV